MWPTAKMFSFIDVNESNLFLWILEFFSNLNISMQIHLYFLSKIAYFLQ